MLYHAALHEGTAKVDRWSMFWSVCVCAMCGFLQVHVHTSEQSANMDIMIRLKHDCMCTCSFAVAVSDQFLQLS